ncbi:metal tolerance protein 10 [Quercus suber]|uniref:Metal tolerance protein 10 n=1 Tax=Quercus suber TaxID=58331 RepID=A0AAW0LJ91_QUESU
MNLDALIFPVVRISDECNVNIVLLTAGKKSEVADYYKKQERLLVEYTEMEAMSEIGFAPESLTEDEMKLLAKSERMAIHISNIANVVLFAAKIFASIESRSLSVIASTLDSLLDLLSGFILWFTAHAMRNPNQYRYPIGKKRMQPVSEPEKDPVKERWMIGIMCSVTIVKFALMVYCRRFKNKIVRAYAQDHFFDVITNSVGLAAAVLAIQYYWWIDPTGAVIIALYTMNTWTKTVFENVYALIGRTAPPEYLAKLTYLVWNHHEDIKHIDTVRAYTIGTHYFVEVDVVLPHDMILNKAHNIGETLQEKLEQLPEVERAFVHIDFEYSHRPEHRTMA